MSLEKTELLGYSDYDWIFKMHVYTLVGPLNYSIHSHINRACMHEIGLESDFAFCACLRFLLPGPRAGSRRRL